MENNSSAEVTDRKLYFVNYVFAMPVPNPGLPMHSQATLGSILLPEFGEPDYPRVTHPFF